MKSKAGGWSVVDAELFPFILRGNWLEHPSGLQALPELPKPPPTVVVVGVGGKMEDHLPAVSSTAFRGAAALTANTARAGRFEYPQRQSAMFGQSSLTPDPNALLP